MSERRSRQGHASKDPPTVARRASRKLVHEAPPASATSLSRRAKHVSGTGNDFISAETQRAVERVRDHCNKWMGPPSVPMMAVAIPDLTNILDDDFLLRIEQYLLASTTFVTNLGTQLSSNPTFVNQIGDSLLLNAAFITNLGNQLAIDDAFITLIGQRLVLNAEFVTNLGGALLLDQDFIDQLTVAIASNNPLFTDTLLGDQYFVDELLALLLELGFQPGAPPPPQIPANTVYLSPAWLPSNPTPPTAQAPYFTTLQDAVTYIATTRASPAETWSIVVSPGFYPEITGAAQVKLGIKEKLECQGAVLRAMALMEMSERIAQQHASNNRALHSRQRHACQDLDKHHDDADHIELWSDPAERERVESLLRAIATKITDQHEYIESICRPLAEETTLDAEPAPLIAPVVVIPPNIHINAATPRSVFFLHNLTFETDANGQAAPASDSANMLTGICFLGNVIRWELDNLPTTNSMLPMLLFDNCPALVNGIALVEVQLNFNPASTFTVQPYFAWTHSTEVFLGSFSTSEYSGVVEFSDLALLGVITCDIDIGNFFVRDCPSMVINSLVYNARTITQNAQFKNIIMTNCFWGNANQLFDMTNVPLARIFIQACYLENVVPTNLALDAAVNYHDSYLLQSASRTNARGAMLFTKSYVVSTVGSNVVLAITESGILSVSSSYISGPTFSMGSGTGWNVQLDNSVVTALNIVDPLTLLRSAGTCIITGCRMSSVSVAGDSRPDLVNIPMRMSNTQVQTITIARTFCAPTLSQCDIGTLNIGDFTLTAPITGLEIDVRSCNVRSSIVARGGVDGTTWPFGINLTVLDTSLATLNTGNGTNWNVRVSTCAAATFSATSVISWSFGNADSIFTLTGVDGPTTTVNFGAAAAAASTAPTFLNLSSVSLAGLSLSQSGAAARLTTVITSSTIGIITSNPPGTATPSGVNIAINNTRCGSLTMTVPNTEYRITNSTITGFSSSVTTIAQVLQNCTIDSASFAAGTAPATTVPVLVQNCSIVAVSDQQVHNKDFSDCTIGTFIGTYAAVTTPATHVVRKLNFSNCTITSMTETSNHAFTLRGCRVGTLSYCFLPVPAPVTAGRNYGALNMIGGSALNITSLPPPTAYTNAAYLRMYLENVVINGTFSCTAAPIVGVATTQAPVQTASVYSLPYDQELSAGPALLIGCRIGYILLAPDAAQGVTAALFPVQQWGISKSILKAGSIAPSANGANILISSLVNSNFQSSNIVLGAGTVTQVTFNASDAGNFI